MDTALKASVVAMTIAVSTAGFSACAARSDSAENSQSMTSRYSQRTLLKNWALSACLAQVAKDAADRTDANSTASAYLEYGQQPLETYDELRTLVKQYADRKYGGSVRSEFNTMKCIDLFHSPALDSLTRKLAP